MFDSGQKETPGELGTEEVRDLDPTTLEKGKPLGSNTRSPSGALLLFAGRVPLLNRVQKKGTLVLTSLL